MAYHGNTGHVIPKKFNDPTKNDEVDKYTSKTVNSLNKIDS